MNDAYSHFLRMYNKGNRTYHGVGHILDLFDLFNGKSIPGLEGSDHYWKHECESIENINYAILAHDCIYDGSRNDNEEKSNEEWIRFSATQYFINTVTMFSVSTLIMCTKKHNVDNYLCIPEGYKNPYFVPTEKDQSVMISLDLSGLASTSEVFDNNTKLIRQEFSHVSDEDWKKGRSAWFESMLKKHEETGIYPHPWAYQHWEQRAVDNIKRGIKLLNK